MTSFLDAKIALIKALNHATIEYNRGTTLGIRAVTELSMRREYIRYPHILHYLDKKWNIREGIYGFIASKMSKVALNIHYLFGDIVPLYNYYAKGWYVCVKPRNGTPDCTVYTCLNKERMVFPEECTPYCDKILECYNVMNWATSFALNDTSVIRDFLHIVDTLKKHGVRFDIGVPADDEPLHKKYIDLVVYDNKNYEVLNMSIITGYRDDENVLLKGHIISDKEDTKREEGYTIYHSSALQLVADMLDAILS